MPRDEVSAQRAVDALLKAPTQSVDLTELAQELLTAWGGTRQFARDVYQQYQDTQPGGMQKGQILKTVLAVIEKHASLNKDDVRPEQRMSEDDLKETISSLMADMGLSGNEHPAPIAADTPAETPA